jgi:zinc transport system substrate-binding protein
LRSFASLLLLFALATSLSCRPKPREPAKIAVTIFPIYDLVKRIAGPDADVTLVLPPGTAPNGWTPTPDAKDRVAHAKLVVSVGLGLDSWVDPLQASGAPKARVLHVGDRVPTIAGADGAIDPHVWMDPQRARLMATAIAEEMARTDSSHATVFRNRASALDASLAALDHEIEVRTASWKGRAHVPPSVGLAYYAERYGLSLDPSASSASGVGHIDALGGSDPATSTYEGLIRASTAALEAALR